MSDDSHLPGSDCYVGHCPECGKITYTCYNELCDDCFDEHEFEQVTDEEADEFTNRILNLTK